MEKARNQINRREFFSKGALWGGLGFLGITLAWIFEDLWSAAGRFSSARWIPVTPVDQLPPESIVPFPEYRIAIFRSGQKIGAISMECTHLGCLLNTVDRGFFCPCHGSDFGPLGEVFSGPATEPLPWHEIMDRDGRIWVHLGKKIEGPKWLALGSHDPARGKEG